MGAHHSLRPHYSRLIALGCAVGLLTGCTGDGPVSPSASPTADAAGSSPSASPSVLESVSPSPSATELSEEQLLAALPENTRHEDFPGAVAFAEFFAKESQDMFHDLDTTLFEALSTAECDFCAQAVERANELQVNELQVMGGELTVDTRNAYGGLQDDETWFIEFPVTVSEQIFVDGEGVEVAKAPEQSYTEVTILQWRDDRWVALELGTKD